MKTEDSLTFEQGIPAYAAGGWKIISDGPSGLQMQAPKRMGGLDKVCLAFGILTVVAYGVGLIFIGIALIDYAFLTKQKTKLFTRDSHFSKAEAQGKIQPKKTSRAFVWVLAVALVFFLLLFAAVALRR